MLRNSGFVKRWMFCPLVALMVANCGQEEIPVACSPEADECETRTEGGFQTGPTAGIAVGAAAALALAAAAGGSSGEGDSSGTSTASTPFYLFNETDHSIQNVFVSASGEVDWGSDKLVPPTWGYGSIYIGEIDCNQRLDFRVDFFPITLGEHKKYNYYNSCSNARLTWTITSISQSSFSVN